MKSYVATNILLCAFASSSQAFSVRSTSSAEILPDITATTSFINFARLNFRDMHDHKEFYLDQSFDAEDAIQIPTYVLPSKADPYRRAQSIATAFDAELVMGRIAMVTAVLLIGTELVSGVSLPEQINRMMQGGWQ